MTKITVNSDIEDALHRAVNMSSILVTLAEKVLRVYEHYGDKEYHDKRRKEGYRSCEPLYINRDDEGTLLFALYETHAQIREAWDLFTGVSDDDVPAPVAEAADANGRAVQS
jgi:hypothetical protein